jgi:hypothetical protein
MVRRIFGPFLCGLVCLALPASGLAQRQTLTATIPFSFSFAEKEMARGEYKIMIAENGVVQMRSDRGEVWAMSRYAHPSNSRTTGTLVFRRYGDLYFLSNITWLGAAVDIPESKSEREVAKSFPRGPTIETATAK